MRSRPEIELHMPPRLQPGEVVDARVILHEHTETPVNAIRVTFRGNRRVVLQQPVVSEICSLAAEVARDVILAPRTYEYRVRFALPPDLPPSCAGGLFGIWYNVHVHVDIPLWPDARDAFTISVVAAPQRRPPPRPHAQTTASGTNPFIELSLDDTVVGPGEMLTGQIAAGHVDPASVQRIKLSLVAEERVYTGSTRWDRTRTYAEYFLAPEGVARGVPLPFKIIVPSDLTPAFQTPMGELRWWFEARLQRSLRSDLVTFVRLDASAFVGQRAASRVARPLLGSDRWRRAWSEAGARHGLALDPDELALAGEIDGADVRIAMTSEAACFGIDLRYPSLGIGLEVSRRRLPFSGIAVDDEAPVFAKRFRVRAREAAQARAALTLRLRRALVAFEEARVDDATAHLTLTGETRDAIGDVLDRVDAVAKAIAVARARIPPPAAMAASKPAWSAFAESNRGALSCGDMRVEARMGGAGFEIATEFDDATPARTRVTARIDPPLPEAIDVGDAAAVGARSRPAVALARELAELGALTVEEDKMTLLLPRPLPDPEEHAATIGSLLRLASLLRGDANAGPYR